MIVDELERYLRISIRFGYYLPICTVCTSPRRTWVPS